MYIINLLKNIINKLTKKEQEKQNKQVDFNKWLGRKGDTLVIKWYISPEEPYKEKKSLISYSNGNLELKPIYEEDYPDKITYQEGTMKDLKVNDVFTFKKDDGKYNTSDFNILLGETYQHKSGKIYCLYFTQYLDECQFENKTFQYIYGEVVELECIESRKVIIFNRY